MFCYDSDIVTRYPAVIGGVIAVRGVQNGATPDALKARYSAEQAVVKARIGDTPLSELPSLAAWRTVFRGFDVDPTQYRCAAEALLRRLTKQGDIPYINTLVDIGNLVSIRYGIPVAVLDTAQMSGGITVHFADGTEQFSDLGSSESVHPEVGEVVFTDEAHVVHARRWCWRQSAQSAARESTTDILITVEAHHSAGRADVTAAVEDLRELLAEFAGGEERHSILNASMAQFT
ncbi:MAG: phenylalanine--tRNA ligase beta subunit-related protein [Chloroflexota bacterium]|nr:phenylalanine--tRNA ligase beta subunit-related protein [Chloroflexota bacterium]